MISIKKGDFLVTHNQKLAGARLGPPGTERAQPRLWEIY